MDEVYKSIIKDVMIPHARKKKNTQRINITTG